MSKFFKSRFTSGPVSESLSKSKVNIEFFYILKNYLKKPGVKVFLNIPETIIMNSFDKIPYLLYTDTEGLLNIKDKISSE